MEETAPAPKYQTNRSSPPTPCPPVKIPDKPACLVKNSTPTHARQQPPSASRSTRTYTSHTHRRQALYPPPARPQVQPPPIPPPPLSRLSPPFRSTPAGSPCQPPIALPPYPSRYTRSAP